MSQRFGESPIEHKLHNPKLHKAIAPRLHELIMSAVGLKMAVAYWTIGKDYFPSDSSRLIQLLQKEGSFACVDISRPTDVSKVCKLAASGASMYFHLEYVDEKNPPPNMPDHLLHSKVLLFDLPENKASILIGSHNWTNRALSGINIETSIELEVDRENEIYHQVNDLLNAIQSECHKVNPALEEVYKNIQRRDNSFLYFQSCIVEGSIDKEKGLFLHFFHEFSLKNSFELNRQIFVFLSKEQNGKEGDLLEGKVTRNELLPKLSPGSNWPNLEEGFWCLELEDGNGYTQFKNVTSLKKEELKNVAGCIATISIKHDQIKNISDIDIDFFSKYKPTLFIREEKKDLKYNEDVENTHWFFRRLSLDLDKKAIKSPIINSDQVSDYMSKIEPGKISKVAKKGKISNNEKRSHP